MLEKYLVPNGRLEQKVLPAIVDLARYQLHSSQSSISLLQQQQQESQHMLQQHSQQQQSKQQQQQQQTDSQTKAIEVRYFILFLGFLLYKFIEIL